MRFFVMRVAALDNLWNTLISTHSLATVLSGFGVGAVVGMTGVGGGSLMTPLLIGLLGVPPATAVGTDLVFAGLTKGFGALAHWRYNQVVWRIVGLMVAASVSSALLTLLGLHTLGNSTSIAHWIKPALGVALLLTALAVFFRSKLHALSRSHPLFSNERAQTAATLILAALIGVLVTLSSVGAGAIGVTALILIYPMISTHRIVGSDIAYAVPLTLIAGAGHAALGHFDLSLLVALLIGSLPGIWLGTKLSTLVPERVLRVLLCACLTFAGIKALA
jgi:uncharacterized membrane protein YfcA